MSSSVLQSARPSTVRVEADRLAASGRCERFLRRLLDPQGTASEDVVVSAIGRAKQGDEDAMRFLYLRYADNVYGYVCSIVRDEHEAEDVTQQIFAKLKIGRAHV